MATTNYPPGHGQSQGENRDFEQIIFRTFMDKKVNSNTLETRILGFLETKGVNFIHNLYLFRRVQSFSFFMQI